jgi:nucleoside-diphosphate-sugar epimerase
MSTVLVTGGSGFIGTHCILRLLREGHTVRTTVRSLNRVPDVKSMLKTGGAEVENLPAERLTFFAADLEKDAGWEEAAAGCDYVLHVASPLPPNLPRHEDEVIVPAREGTLRVLRAARGAGVQRVVVTSSFAAVGYGVEPRPDPFNENDWTDVNAEGLTPYVKSKALAERAAWDFMTREGGRMQMATVNPVAVFGPVLGPDYSASILLVQRLMVGAMPGCPRLYFGAVDVRDVADLHLRAMTAPAAAGQRFLAVAGDSISMVEMGRILRRNMGEAARRVPKSEIPNWMVRLASLRDPAVKQIIPELGRVKHSTHAKAARLLGWSPRPAEEAIVASAESLVRLGLLKNGAR